MKSSTMGILGGLAVVVLSAAITFFYLSEPTPKVGAPASPPAGALPTSSVPERPGYNLAWPSQDFANSKYRADFVQVIANEGTAPDGTKTAARLTEMAANNLHRIEVSIGGLASGGIHTISLFVKPVERSGIILEVRDNPNGNYGSARFVLNEGETASKSGDVVNAGIKAVENGWYRVWATMPFVTNQAAVDVDLLSQEGGGFYEGDGKSGLMIWGLQLETARMPGPYATTTTEPSGATSKTEPEKAVK